MPEALHCIRSEPFPLIAAQKTKSAKDNVCLQTAIFHSYEISIKKLQKNIAIHNKVRYNNRAMPEW